MNKAQANGGNPSRDATALSKSSVVIFFVVGAILLVVPVLIVTGWQNSACNPEFKTLCLGSTFYKDSVQVLPYVMIVGGLVIGYNMKRLSDSLVAREKRELEESGGSGDYEDDGEEEG